MSSFVPPTEWVIIWFFKTPGPGKPGPGSVRHEGRDGHEEIQKRKELKIAFLSSCASRLLYYHFRCNVIRV
jgi:hypothetical protein